MLPKLCVVVTCMGRLAHLKLTAPRIIESGKAGYVLVDFSCPDLSGAWLASAFPEGLAAGRVNVVECPGNVTFHKTRALNAGARCAIEKGAELLCFADADTLFGAKGLEQIEALAEPGCFLIAKEGPNGRSVRSLTGLLVVTARDFGQAGGYEEEFTGWGGEDVAMRLKLHLVAGLVPRTLPASAAYGIPHSDRLRTRFASETNLLQSAARNDALLKRLVEGWTGRSVAELPPSAQSLLFRA